MEVLPVSRTHQASGTPISANDAPIRSTSRLARLKRLRSKWLFLAVVVVPVLLAVLYFGFLASAVYISESKFVVRSPEKPQATGLGVVLQTAGFTSSNNEIYAAQSYAVSRDALRAINQNGRFESAYSSPDIFVLDRFNPFGFAGSFEDLYEYFGTKVKLLNDTTTSISTLTVRAYTPEEAYRVNQRLLEMSEATVNRLNVRGREDRIRYARNEVADAKAQAQASAVALAAFRNSQGVVDPEKQADVQLQMVSKLQDQLIASRTELAQLQQYAPRNPRIPVMQTQIASIESDIAKEMGKVTGNRGSLAQTAVRYQRLVLENELANKQLTASLGSLEQARNEAQRQQAYVERIVQPSLPDAPMEPKRLRGIFATLALALLAYGILRMLIAGVKEHAQ
jgi:capsular polysaccharide transport system permease protein